LPTALGVSSVTTGQVWTSLGGFVLFYTALAVIDVVLMVKYARKGPDGLGLWPPGQPSPAPVATTIPAQA
jgi:cytochrome d ubiquinol oxidase subunit I